MKNLLAIAMLLISTPALAQNFYAGASIGQSSTDVDTGPFAADLAALGIGHGGIRSDETDTAWKIYGGYRFHRNFALEAGVVQLGEIAAETTVTSLNGVPVVPGTARSTVEADPGFFLSGAGILPLNQAHIFGRVGLYSIKVIGTATLSGVGGTLSASESDRSTGLLFGAGIGYDFTPQFGVRAEFERYMDVGDTNTGGGGDVDVVSIGALVRF